MIFIARNSLYTGLLGNLCSFQGLALRGAQGPQSKPPDSGAG